MVKNVFPFILAQVLVAQTKTDSLVRSSFLREDSSLALVQKMPFSGHYSEYSAVKRGDLLFFVSDRPNRTAVQYTDVQDNPGITDIFYVSLSHGKKPRAPQELNGVNSIYYEGPFCFSVTGDTIYFTGNDQKNKHLRIMMSEKKGGKWNEPESLAICKDTFSYCHPSLSNDGRTLYFSSNRDGRKDMDIFSSSRTDSGWSAPLNVPLINSEFNELFPFSGQNGYLYFSSNRPGGPGGLDLYRFGPGDKHAQALYPPINSASDDFGIFICDDGDTGYFSSNREEKKNDDVFRFERSIPDFSNAESPPIRTRFCYSFYEETSMHDNDTAGTEYEWRFGDGGTAKGLRSRHCYQSPGSYTVQLLVIEKISKKVNSTIVDYAITIAEPEQLKIQSPDSVLVFDTLICDASESAIKDHDINNIYWSFGDGFYNRGPLVGHRYRNEGKYILELWVTATHRPTNEIKKYRISKTIMVRAIK